MKITIPSRIAAPTAPPDGTASGVSAPQASTSATPSTQQATPKIRIKQSNPNAGTTTPSTLTSTSSATAAAPTAAAGIPQIKTEEAPSEANNNNNDNANASSTTTAATTTAATGKSPYPIKEDNTGFNSSLILPGKRKRTSLTPNNAAANSSNDSAANKANQHQTRHTATQEEIDKAYADGFQLWQVLRDHPRRDGKPMSTEFMHLPPRDDFPDYYAMIKNKAISFTEIRLKIERREYGTHINPTASNGVLKLISDDFKQLFFNAKRYNVKGSNIYNDARKLDRLHRHTYERLAGIKTDTNNEDQDEGGGDNEDNNQTGGKGVTPTVNAQRSGSTTPAVQGSSQQPPKKKYKKSQPQLDDKPITLTKWLSNKVDDLVAMTDKSGRVLSEVFMQVPPQAQYPDYYQLIARPISFQLVRSRLKNRNYQTIEKFKDDVNLIFTNAQTYNEDGSLIWQDAQQLKEYFNTLMQEEPPEFFVRPRNQSQQAVGSKDHDGDQSKYRYASATNVQGYSYPPFANAGAGNTVHSISPFSMPAQNAYDTVKFGEFDEHDVSMDAHDEGNSAADISVEQPQQRDLHDSGMAVDQFPNVPSPVKVEPAYHQQQPQFQQSMPLQPYHTGHPQTASIPIPQHLAPAQSIRNESPYSTTTPKNVSKLVDPSHPSTIKTFTIALRSRTSPVPLLTYHLANTTVRQHTLTLGKNVDFVEITPVMSNIVTRLEVRGRQRMAQVYDSDTTQEERSDGAYEKKFTVQPGQSLMTVEIKAGNEELYRIFFVKLSV